jgi:hypothetical protein
MKKVLSILLIIIYSTATFGMSVKEFYCCGKLKTISVSFNNADKVTSEKLTKNDGCCKTKYHVSKIKDNHVSSNVATLAAKHFTHPEVIFPALDILPVSDVQFQESNAIHGPPPLLHGNTPIYIFIRVLRI